MSTDKNEIFFAQLSKYTRELQLTIFKGTSMLEKEVPKIIE